ncbi:VOC family protein [Aerococcus viridans]
MDGGPYFRFNEVISLMHNCESQDEIDYYCENYPLFLKLSSMVG